MRDLDKMAEGIAVINRDRRIRDGAMRILGGFSGITDMYENMTAEEQIAEAFRRATLIEDAEIPAPSGERLKGMEWVPRMFRYAWEVGYIETVTEWPMGGKDQFTGAILNAWAKWPEREALGLPADLPIEAFDPLPEDSAPDEGGGNEN